MNKDLRDILQCLPVSLVSSLTTRMDQLEEHTIHLAPLFQSLQ